MNTKALCGSVAAAVLASGIGVLAQTQPPQTTQTSTTTDQKKAVTVSGCVQKETAVLKRNPVLGEAGMEDEFVLTNATLTPSEQPPPSPAGTTGSASNLGKVYRVTGDKEKELKNYLGQRVEITGAFKRETDAKSDPSSIGAGAKSGELTAANTPEITISSIRPVSGSCPGTEK